MLAFAIERIRHLQSSHERATAEEIHTLFEILDDVREGFDAEPDLTTKTDRARHMVATHYLKLLQLRTDTPVVVATPARPDAAIVRAADDAANRSHIVHHDDDSSEEDNEEEETEDE